MQWSLQIVAMLCLLACAGNNTGREADPVVPSHGSAVDGNTRAASTDAATSAHHWEALLDGKRVLDFEDRPGVLVDSSAPPPPPGAPLATHPFLTGSCTGSPQVCVKLGELLRAASDIPSFIEALREAGFDVRPR